MTRNQLEYWKNQETERHNKVLESQGLESLILQRQANEISASNVAETGRANRARELENYRSNLAHEANEALRTSETIRSNKANEQIGWANVSARYAEIGVQQQNADTRYSELLENIRHNRTVESYQKNANPWQSIATTLDEIWNRGSQSNAFSNVVTNVKTGVNNFVNGFKQGLTDAKTQKSTSPVNTYSSTAKRVTAGSTTKSSTAAKTTSTKKSQPVTSKKAGIQK